MNQAIAQDPTAGPTRATAVCYLNGQRTVLGADVLGLMLADYLREVAHLTGTKIVCAEGDCGACTVLIARPRPVAAQPTAVVFEAVNSCILRMSQCDGASVVTVEGLATPDKATQASIPTHGPAAATPTHTSAASTHAAMALSPALTTVQHAVRDAHGSQCGYCTPGIVCALAGLTDRRRNEGATRPITTACAKNALTGNLCRCTGYQPILDGASHIDVAAWEPLAARYLTDDIVADLRASTALPLHAVATPPAVSLSGPGPAPHAATVYGTHAVPLAQFASAQRGGSVDAALTVFAPTSAAQVCEALLAGYRIVAGGTDLGVLANKGKLRPPKIVALDHVPGMFEIAAREGRLRVGALATIANVRRALKGRFDALASYLDLFASPQIKNSATLIGNLANGSPIGDAVGALMVCATQVHLVGPAGRRDLPLEQLYAGYRQLRLGDGEWLEAVSFALPSPSERVRFCKVSQRKDLDISAVNGGAWVTVSSPDAPLREARVAAGGVGPVVLRLPALEHQLAALPLSALRDPAQRAALTAVAQSEIAPISDLRGSAAYRRVLFGNWLDDLLRQLGQETP